MKHGKNDAKLEKGQNLWVWCDEHQCYHGYSYDYVLGCAPVNSHANRGY